MRFRGEYDQAWVQTATAVKDAAGWRCIRCGHPHGDHMFTTSDEERVAQYEQEFSGSVLVTFGDVCWRVKAIVRCTPDCSHPKDGKLRTLTVHHLDGHKANDAWWNLLALCQVCHLQVQAKVIPERQFLFRHSAWFVPYVCGFYAHYYGKQEITRAEADATPDKWLAMGQPWLYEGTEKAGHTRSYHPLGDGSTPSTTEAPNGTD